MKWELGNPQSEGLSVTMDLPRPTLTAAQAAEALNSQESGSARKLVFVIVVMRTPGNNSQ
jgi:hypothetical protein